jgi:hypothetical protein
MLALDTSSRALDASIASTSTFRAIPALGQFNVGRRVSTNNGFDAVMEDVDKHPSFSARRTVVGAREGLTLKSALLHRNETEQRFPPSMISFDQVPVVHCPAGALHTCNVDTLHHHHHATILVLESFFDGIDDHVDVRQEVWDYDRSLVSSVHAG